MLLEQLLPDDRRAVLDAAARVPLRLADDIVGSGQPILAAYFPVSGIISAVNETSDGRSVEAFMVGREGMTGVEAAVVPAPSGSRQTVQSDGEAFRIDTGRLRELTERSTALRRTLALYQAGLQRELEQTAACHALHQAERRLAKWLLRCHDRVEADVIKLTQEYVASMLGSQRTTVNDAAQTLQRGGAVSYSRGTLRVLDRRALERAACECYRKSGASSSAAAPPDRGTA